MMVADLTAELIAFPTQQAGPDGAEDRNRVRQRLSLSRVAQGFQRRDRDDAIGSAPEPGRAGAGTGQRRRHGSSRDCGI